MKTKQDVVVTCTIPLDSGFTHILFNIAAQGYSHIVIEYSGSGDSGGIDEIYAVKRGGVKENEGDIPELKSNFVRVDLDGDLEQVIQDVAYKQVLNDATDWYNNEGGGGRLFISTDDSKYEADHYYNVVSEEHEQLSGRLGDAHDGPSD